MRPNPLLCFSLCHFRLFRRVFGLPGTREQASSGRKLQSDQSFTFFSFPLLIIVRVPWFQTAEVSRYLGRHRVVAAVTRLPLVTVAVSTKRAPRLPFSVPELGFVRFHACSPASQPFAGWLRPVVALTDSLLSTLRAKRFGSRCPSRSPAGPASVHRVPSPSRKLLSTHAVQPLSRTPAAHCAHYLTDSLFVHTSMPQVLFQCERQNPIPSGSSITSRGSGFALLVSCPGCSAG